MGWEAARTSKQPPTKAMTVKRKEMEHLDLDVLADHMGEPPASFNKYIAEAEMERRRTILQQQATTAQIEAAVITKRNSWFMLAAVVIQALALIVTASFQVWDRFLRN
jgi:hypothetical protein